MSWGSEIDTDWIRPTTVSDARAKMIDAEKVRNFQEAALAAVALADLCTDEYGNPTDSTASFERQALVYATLHQADTALFIAENRQPTIQFAG